ncbi:uncharacterized protein LOC133196843 [Saccostrea echinata]|uniref:uncharacterized protein LOC133196843 n=1 Tax=Saccostrea echinata TaxID=191078 RepID=UPI002A80C040|nr:uncharacterized protein LOC133196843 [Saccostrea echinata]
MDNLVLLIDYRRAPVFVCPPCFQIGLNSLLCPRTSNTIRIAPGDLLNQSLAMCRSLSRSTRVSIGGMVLGFLLQIVGVSMPHWCDSTSRQTKRVNFGLWKTCEDIGRLDEHVPICQFSLDTQMIVVQVLEVLGVLGSIFTPCLVFAAAMKYENKCRTSIFSILSAFGTASCIIMGVVIFGVEVPDENWKLSWSFGFSAAAGVSYLGVFVALICVAMEI